jgi:hypothetical protein
MPKIKLTIEHGLAVTPLVEGEPAGTLRGPLHYLDVA